MYFYTTTTDESCICP